MKEGMRLYQEYLAWEVSKSVNSNINELMRVDNINCYAFARRLSYPDKDRKIYTPGNIFRLKYGYGEILFSDTDFEFIDSCVQRDSEAIGQKTIRISFEDITETDKYYYFGIAIFQLGTDLEWHFVMRTSDGIWLHKPNWHQSAEEIQWLEFGKKFEFKFYNPFLREFIPIEGICAEKFFYRVE